MTRNIRRRSSCPYATQQQAEQHGHGSDDGAGVDSGNSVGSGEETLADLDSGDRPARLASGTIGRRVLACPPPRGGAKIRRAQFGRSAHHQTAMILIYLYGE